MNNKIKNQLKKLPSKPGIYLFYNNQQELIYVGKATNLNSRVKSYFKKNQTNGRPIEFFINQIEEIKNKATDSVLEAIILESNYIKKYQPKYNVLGKDNKSWNYLYLTNEKFPRLKTIRQHELKQIKNNKNKFKQAKLKKKDIFGPFPGLKSHEALKILHKLFNISRCQSNQQKPCFDYQLSHCLGVCTGEISPEEYNQKVIKPLKLFLKGQKKRLLTNLKKKMLASATQEHFEEATRLRNQINNLQKIQDINLINQNFFDILEWKNKKNFLLEAYDISNLGSDNNVGSMIVFNQNGPLKKQYKKFKIKKIKGQNDTAAIQEMISRRLKHSNWQLPNYFLIDGGKPQVNAVKKQLTLHNIKLPVIGIAKGTERKKNEFIYKKSPTLKKFIQDNYQLLIHARDEAHRFALKYQRQLRKIK